MAETKTVATEAIASGTARSWEEWLAFLAGIGAEDMPHAEIARRVQETGDASGWWAQTITVAFEQHIGRRKPGQRGDGSFEISATRTLPGETAGMFAELCARMERVRNFDGVATAAAPRVSITRWRSYWRCKLENGTGVAFALEQKARGKVLVAVTHEKLASEADAARWRAFWKAELGKL